MLENVSGYEEVYRKQVLEPIELSQTVLKEWGFFKRSNDWIWLYYWNESGETENLGYTIEGCDIIEERGKLYFHKCLTETGIEVTFLHELQNH